MALLVSLDYHLTKFFEVFVERYAYDALVRNLHGNLAGLVRYVSHHERIASFVRQFVQGERTVQPRRCLYVRQLLYLNHRADKRFARTMVLDYAVEGVG